MDVFFALRQEGSVDGYAHCFEEHMHKILLYNPSYDETFFVNRFMEGLKQEIRAAVKLQHLVTVDVAFACAQTQEALLTEATRRLVVKPDFKHRNKQYVHQGLLGSAPGDQKATEKGKFYE